MTECEGIKERLERIVSNFKTGKDITEELVSLTSDDSSQALLHDYFLDSGAPKDVNFLVPLAEIPIPVGDEALDYFSVEDLKVQGFSEKLVRMSSRLETAVDIDLQNFIEGRIIDDVYVSIRGQMEGQSGPRIYQLTVTSTIEEFREQCKQDEMLLCDFGGGCQNYSDQELVEIWDLFVAKAFGGK